MMCAVFRVRLGMAVAAISLIGLSGCSKDDGNEAAGSTTSTTERPPWAGQGEDDVWLALDDVCTQANEAALAAAEQLLPLTTEPEPHDLARYYRARSQQVAELATTFQALTPPADLERAWLWLMDGLQQWAQWADEAADRVEVDGLDADLTQPPGLEEFRTSFEWGACAVLLDVN